MSEQYTPFVKVVSVISSVVFGVGLIWRGMQNVGAGILESIFGVMAIGFGIGLLVVAWSIMRE